MNGDISAAHQVLMRLEHELGNLSILAPLPEMVRTIIGSARSEVKRAVDFTWGYSEALKDAKGKS